MDDKFKPEKIHEKFKKAKNILRAPMFKQKCSEEVKVHIRPNSEVPRGKFKPDPLSSGTYMAHPVTIRAVRKELFVAGNDLFLDLEDKFFCSSCSSELDRQFWKFCPFCEGQIEKNI